MKIVIQILLIALIVVLAYFLYTGIEKPIEFQKAYEKRYEVVVKKLKDIRKAQLAYKDVYGSFTGSFDTLINSLKNDSMPFVKAIGHVPDSLTELEAVELGIVNRDTFWMYLRDTVFAKGYCFDSLRFVPFTNSEEFELGAGVVETGSNVDVRVFEAKTHFKQFLAGLDKQLIINLVDDKKTNSLYPGLKVGSLEEATNNAGNWE